jgi:Domain of unknown function (DUF5615)
LRLALDELYAPRIAEELRARGHDVVAVLERADWRGLSDSVLFSVVAVEKRALVTENWAHFQRELDRAATIGLDPFGVLFTSRKGLPRSRNTIGLFVRVLDDFLLRHPTDDALLNSSRWLS